MSWEEFLADGGPESEGPDQPENERHHPSPWTAAEEQHLFPAKSSLEESVMECLGKIKNARYRDVLNFKYFEDLSHQDIADRLKTTVVNSRALLMRASLQIRYCLENNLDFNA